MILSRHEVERTAIGSHSIEPSWFKRIGSSEYLDRVNMKWPWRYVVIDYYFVAPICGGLEIMNQWLERHLNLIFANLFSTPKQCDACTKARGFLGSVSPGWIKMKNNNAINVFKMFCRLIVLVICLIDPNRWYAHLYNVCLGKGMNKTQWQIFEYLMWKP